MTPSPLPLSSMAADRIRAFRTARRISGDTFAEGVTQAGYRLTRSTLANIETKRFRTLPIDLLDVVAEYLGVSYYGFFHGPLCNSCDDEPPKAFICKVCGRTRGEDGKLVRC